MKQLKNYRTSDIITIFFLLAGFAVLILPTLLKFERNYFTVSMVLIGIGIVAMKYEGKKSLVK